MELGGVPRFLMYLCYVFGGCFLGIKNTLIWESG